MPLIVNRFFFELLLLDLKIAGRPLRKNKNRMTGEPLTSQFFKAEYTFSTGAEMAME